MDYKFSIYTQTFVDSSNVFSSVAFSFVLTEFYYKGHGCLKFDEIHETRFIMPLCLYRDHSSFFVGLKKLSLKVILDVTDSRSGLR